MFLFRACAVVSRLSCFLRAGVPSASAAFLPTLSSSSSFSSLDLDYLLSSLSPSQCTSKNNTKPPPPPQGRTLCLYPDRNTFSDLNLTTTTTTTWFPLSFERRRRRLVTYTKSAMASTSTSTVVFVLGGPGSGKGTQCKRLTEHFGFVHFSAGDLLRAFVKSGTEEGNQVAAMMQEGKIVPSEVTVNLLKKAMEESGKDKFLIDGFPRNLENRDTFLRVVGHDCSFVLFFDCPEEVLEARLLNRGEGRADDNIETIRKRFKTYQDQTMPVIEHYKGLDKVREVKTDVGIDQVWEVVSGLFK